MGSFKEEEGQGEGEEGEKEENIKEWLPSNENELVLRTFQSARISTFPHRATTLNKSHCLGCYIPGNWSMDVQGESLQGMPGAYKVVKGSLPVCLSSTGSGPNIQGSHSFQ